MAVLNFHQKFVYEAKECLLSAVLLNQILCSKGTLKELKYEGIS